VYGDFLGPLLRSKLEEDPGNEILGEAFSLIEDLLVSGDEYATSVVVTSVLDHLGSMYVREGAWELAGPRTRQFLAKLREWQQ
jgi:hypothetical protein